MGAEEQRRYKERHPERIAESERRYSTTQRGRETRSAAKRAWKERNPERVREHNRILRLVRTAVVGGRLIKSPCVECGVEKVQAHHHNGYGPEHVLDVTWLCSRHHADAHVALGRAAA